MARSIPNGTEPSTGVGRVDVQPVGRFDRKSWGARGNTGCNLASVPDSDMCRRKFTDWRVESQTLIMAGDGPLRDPGGTPAGGDPSWAARCLGSSVAMQRVQLHCCRGPTNHGGTGCQVHLMAYH